MALDRGPLDALTRLLAADLTGASVDDLLTYFQQIEQLELVAKGKAIDAMRATATDAGKTPSWRELAKITGKPQATLRSWHRRYLETMREAPSSPPS